MGLHHGEHGEHGGGTGKIGWDVTAPVVSAAIKVHSALGPGLLESVYEECLCRELSKGHIAFQRQVQIPILYDGLALATGPRLDLQVGDNLIVEVKAVESLTPLHDAQLLTYLRMARMRFGLLINFNVSRLMNGGIRRKIV